MKPIFILIVVLASSNIALCMTTQTKDSVWRIATKHVLPAVKSSQRCSFHKSPNVEGRQLITDEHIIKNDKVHHIDIFRCSHPLGNKFFDDFLRTDGYSCDNSSIPAEFCQYYCFWNCPYPPPRDRYPSNAGHIFENNQYRFMVIHYENPELLENVEVEGGVEFSYTPNYKEYESAFLQVGRYVSYKNLIPPNSKDFVVPHTCQSDCTEKFDKPIHIFGITFHAHDSAKQVKLYHLRNGQEVAVLAHDTHYSPDEPFKFKKLENHYKVLRGDELRVECTYDTTRAHGEVKIGGNTLENEMCIAFVEYYPRSFKFSNCGTTVEAEAIQMFFGIQQIDSELSVDPRIISPLELAGSTFTEVVKNWDWSDSERARFQELMLNGAKDSYCSPNQY